MTLRRYSCIVLDDVKVVSLAINLPGPLAAAAPAWYAALTEGQQIVALDVKDAGDRAKLEELLATADLLITSMRPSALARLGLERPHERVVEL